MDTECIAKKSFNTNLILRTAFFFLIPGISAVSADVGVFTGSGQTLRQISTESVQLVSIDVKITLGRGRFLFDGTVPGFDQAEYECRFVLKNLADGECSVKTGFPIDSQSDDPPESFIARDEKVTYHVDFQNWKPPKPNDSIGAIFTWMMNFKPHETKIVSVRYRLPISVTLASTSKRGIGADRQGADKPWMSLADHSILEFAGYTTETGSSWSGNVTNAKFTVLTAEFERYLNHRGIIECLPADLPDDETKEPMQSLPVKHPWWYRDIKPAGWREIPGGLSWEYHDFKPKHAIRVGYYLTQFPRLPAEVDPWIDTLLKKVVPSKNEHSEALSALKQVLLAAYGQVPGDLTVRAYVEDQVWYHPNKQFSHSSLSSDQEAVLKALDSRLDSINKPR